MNCVELQASLAEIDRRPKSRTAGSSENLPGVLNSGCGIESYCRSWNRPARGRGTQSSRLEFHRNCITAGGTHSPTAGEPFPSAIAQQSLGLGSLGGPGSSRPADGGRPLRSPAFAVSANRKDARPDGTRFRHGDRRAQRRRPAAGSGSAVARGKSAIPRRSPTRQRLHSGREERGRRESRTMRKLGVR